MEHTLSTARQLDAQDPLHHLRSNFHLPQTVDGHPEALYLCGNSLGLMPKVARDYVTAELDDWAKYGVEGHFHARSPWMPYHSLLTEKMAGVVGALPQEVVVMNSLTVNLHLMMVSFYRPTSQRYKILIDYNPFPSDRYAVDSQARYHGYDPSDAIIELQPHRGSEVVNTDDILEQIERYGDEIALVMIGGVNYYTGQYYDVPTITAAAHKRGCKVGFDMAHGAGNIALQLHDDGPDFAVWCTYKYLNGGPGSLSGCFVHDRHARSVDLPRFAGWWGHDESTRFMMDNHFVPMAGAEGWQLSNPPIMAMAAMRASLDLFDQVGMPALAAKSRQLTAYLESLLLALDTTAITVITPIDTSQRGCQLSIQVQGADKSLFDTITGKGVVADWREPDVIRVAPVPMYNTYEEVYRFVDILQQALHLN